MRRGIFAGRLAEGCGILRDVEHVVNNLKCQSGVSAEGPKPADLSGSGAGVDASGDDGNGDQSAGLGAVDLFDQLCGRLGVFALQVHHLAANHSADGAGSACDFSDDGDGMGGGALQLGEHFVSLRL